MPENPVTLADHEINLTTPGHGCYRGMVVISSPPLCGMTPDEARSLAEFLQRAADVAEVRG